MAGFTALRLVLAARFPLLAAETYYWLWSRALDWGYYDHPPMVAAVIGVFSPLLGDSALGVRLGVVLLSSLGSLLFYALCLRLVPVRAALASLLVLSIAPLWISFGVVVTPDGPLLFFWVLTLLLFHRAWQGNTLLAWVAAGVAAGLTLMSKYTGALLFPVFFAFLLVDPRGRRQLLTPRPYLAAIVAGLVMVPNILWNLDHGGETVRTPFRDGLEPHAALGHLGEYAVLPLALLTPLIAVAWVWQSIAGIRDGRLRDHASFRFLLCTSWLPFGAFGVVAILTQVQDRKSVV